MCWLMAFCTTTLRFGASLVTSVIWLMPAFCERLAVVGLHGDGHVLDVLRAFLRGHDDLFERALAARLLLRES